MSAIPGFLTEAFGRDLTKEEAAAVYLDRLARLRRLERQHCQELNEKGWRLTNKATFAAFCVLRDLGLSLEAKAILKEEEEVPALLLAV